VRQGYLALSAAQVRELSFGGALGGALAANASDVLRTLPAAGAGLCVNYLLDGPGADNGTALARALQARRPGVLEAGCLASHGGGPCRLPASATAASLWILSRLPCGLTRHAMRPVPQYLVEAAARGQDPPQKLAALSTHCRCCLGGCRARSATSAACLPHVVPVRDPRALPDATRRRARQGLRPGSLRYPGGEKANSFMWAPPPFTAGHSRPLLTSEAGWPATAPALYNLSAHDYVAPPLDFEGFMRLVDATGAEPYIVLNLAGKSNMEPAASAQFNASVLKAGAAAWLGHIRARGYNVTRFELTNEAYNQMPVAAYAAAVLDWAPALRAALPGALLGASGPSFIDAVGKQARAASIPTPPYLSPARRSGPSACCDPLRWVARARLPRTRPRPYPLSIVSSLASSRGAPPLGSARVRTGPQLQASAVRSARARGRRTRRRRGGRSCWPRRRTRWTSWSCTPTPCSAGTSTTMRTATSASTARCARAACHRVLSPHPTPTLPLAPPTGFLARGRRAAAARGLRSPAARRARAAVDGGRGPGRGGPSLMLSHAPRARARRWPA
jgi:hypothetical protein